MGGDTTFLEGQVEAGLARPQRGQSCLLHGLCGARIAERPQSAADRRTPDLDWEADLMLFSTYGHAVLTMHERYSRILIALRAPWQGIQDHRRCDVAGARSVAA